MRQPQEMTGSPLPTYHSKGLWPPCPGQMRKPRSIRWELLRIIANSLARCPPIQPGVSASQDLSLEAHLTGPGLSVHRFQV
jgi:hypothetical protein